MVVAPNGITSPLLVLLKKIRSRVAHHMHTNSLRQFTKYHKLPIGEKGSG
jgi:L-lysine 2,3-aminomutase